MVRTRMIESLPRTASRRSHKHYRRRLLIEQLERRVVLASGIGAIEGIAFHDQTLDGLTADDPRLENVQVLLYADTNGNAQFDSGTDLPVGGEVTDVDGQFRFDGLAGGDYFVVQDSVRGLRRPDPVFVDDLNDAGIQLAKIDDYSLTDQAVMASSASPSVETSEIAFEAIGNARDIQATFTSGSGSVGLTISSASEDLTFGLMFAVGSLLVQYDGEDGSISLDATGLAGVSLGSGMPGEAVPTGSGFHVETHATGVMDDLVISVYTDATNFSTYRLAIPVSATFVEEFIPFSSFTAAQGAGADFNDVGGIEASIDLSGSAAARVAIIETLRPDVQTVNLQNIQQVGVGPTDLAITKTAGATQVSEGDSIAYTIVVTNHGPNDVTGATVTDAFPPELIDVTWTAAVTNGTGTVTGSGSGDINEMIDLADGSEITFTVTATVVDSLTANQAADKIVTNAARVAHPDDTDPSNNTATDSDVVVLAVSNLTAGSFANGGVLPDSHAVDVGLGDLDGDQDLDVFVVNSFSAAPHSVWLNNGDGTFARGVSLENSDDSRGVSLGDLDGDGDLDAFVVNRGFSDGVNDGVNQVWLNNGDGTFARGVSLENSDDSRGVSLGDLDGDGDLDAFVANAVANQVWLNNGDGTFTSGVSLGNSGNIGVSLGDLDADGDLDAFVANVGGNRVWLNRGDGTFTSGASLGDSPSQDVSLADLDGDGDLDAFVVKSGSNSADPFEPNQVWLNNGDGTFNSGVTLGNSTSLGVNLADLDGDGDLDAFVANVGANQVWHNNGDGTFRSGVSLGDAYSSGVGIGDLDLDGDLDAIVANSAIISRVFPIQIWINGSADLRIHKTARAVQVSEGETIQYEIVVSNDGPDDVKGATVTDDFSPELTNVNWTASVTQGSGTVTGSGTGDIDEAIDLTNGSEITFTVTATVVDSLTANQPAAKIVTNSARVEHPEDIDLSNNSATDGDVVVLAVSNPTPGLFVHRGSLRDSSSVDVRLGDLDGDGDLDAFVASAREDGVTGASNRVWLNDGSGNYSDSGNRLGDSFSFSLELGDLDGDGDLDAFVANVGDNVAGMFTGEPNRVWLNDGSGNFVVGSGLGNSISRAVSLGDLDGDGDLDAFVANGFADDGMGGVAGGPSRVWLNNGVGEFTDSGEELAIMEIAGVSLGDLDGDGDLDAFVANDGPNQVWVNDGNASFSDSGVRLGDSDSLRVGLGDLDGDGDLDAFVANDGPSQVWFNNGQAVFISRNQLLGNPESVSLADLDGDGDLDAFVVDVTSNLGDGSRSNRVWLNDGGGLFFDSDRDLGNAKSLGVSLGDLDADGDLDAWVANVGPDQVWLNVDPVVDLRISKTAGATQVSEGDLISYTIVVSNDGPDDVSGATVTDTFPRELTGVSWTAAVTGSGDVAASGSGDIDETIDLTNGSEITFTVTATVVGSLSANQPAAKIVTNSAHVEHPEDMDLSNNSATDGDIVVFSVSNPTHALFAPGSSVGDSPSFDVRLGDLDGDGDLDAFVANVATDSVTGEVIGGPNRVWLNDGSGNYSEIGNGLGDSFSLGLDLGDLDGDGDLDAFVANAQVSSGTGEPNRVWLNDGDGNFSDNGQALGDSPSFGMSLGDLDGDGDLDAFVANAGTSPNRVWLNDGGGNFIDSQQELGNSNSRSVSLGDLNGDGHLDAFVANLGEANRVWLNDGSGNFTDSGQSLGDSDSEGVSLGDLNGDGFLDAFVANDTANRVWLNDGNGMFQDSNQLLGNSESEGVSLGDLDGDGDLDAFVANKGSNLPDPDEHPNRVWLNDGSGNFTEHGSGLGDSVSRGVSLGDLDGDGDLDAFVANSSPNQVWLNAVADLRINKAAAPDPVTAGTGQVYTIVVTNDGPDEATGVVVTDPLPSGVSFASGNVDGDEGDVSFDSASNTVTGNVGVLASAATSTITITVDVAPTRRGS